MTVPLLVDIASLLDQLGITPASMRIEWPLTSPARASIHLRNPDDLAAVCAATGTPIPEPRRGRADLDQWAAMTRDGRIVLTALDAGRPGTAEPDWRPTGPCRHCRPDTSHPTPKETP